MAPMLSPRSAILLPSSSMVLSSPETRSGGRGGRYLRPPPRGVKQGSGAPHGSQDGVPAPGQGHHAPGCHGRGRIGGGPLIDTTVRTLVHSRLFQAIPAKKMRPVKPAAATSLTRELTIGLEPITCCLQGRAEGGHRNQLGWGSLPGKRLNTSVFDRSDPRTTAESNRVSCHVLRHGVTSCVTVPRRPRSEAITDGASSSSPLPAMLQRCPSVVDPPPQFPRIEADLTTQPDRGDDPLTSQFVDPGP
jgi:hypothetical protein